MQYDNCVGQINTPSYKSQSIQEASETIPGATPDQIANRVKLLLLPEQLQNAVDNRELTQETALALTRLKDLGSVQVFKRGAFLPVRDQK